MEETTRLLLRERKLCICTKRCCPVTITTIPQQNNDDYYIQLSGYSIAIIQSRTKQKRISTSFTLHFHLQLPGTVDRNSKFVALHLKWKHKFPMQTTASLRTQTLAKHTHTNNWRHNIYRRCRVCVAHDHIACPPHMLRIV